MHLFESIVLVVYVNTCVAVCGGVVIVRHLELVEDYVPRSQLAVINALLDRSTMLFIEDSGTFWHGVGVYKVVFKCT